MEEKKSCPVKCFGGCCALVAVLLVSVSIALCGYFVYRGLQTFNSADRIVSVKGLAERDVVADLAIWTVNHTATGNDLAAVQAEIERNREKIMAFLTQGGFAGEEISENALQLQDLLANSYRPEGAAEARYILTQTIKVRTAQIDKLDGLVNQAGKLIREGVTLANTQQPVYLFTGLNDIKPEMLAEAVKNAREAADAFARDAGTNVGAIKAAQQGVFQIQPRDEIGYEQNTTQKHQKVRVVSTLTFYLEE